ncbi:MAG TPA: hypothetical protein VFJ43_16300 [Bacteroidia bacterium]|nr:hypothetical protein [Bacteroidia bacterium]
MKLFYACFVTLLLVTRSYAQTTTTTTTATTPPTPQTSNCYTRWEEKFEERGATEVKDGIYTDVIISVRSGPEAQCYSGKVEVKDGKIISMERKLADGTYEPYKPKLKYEIPMIITTGISATLLTMDDDLINVIFPSTLKPKKVAYSTAPDPPQD